MKKNETTILRTNNYDMFKKLEGNREINSKKVNKIKKSINDVGYISNPIIVNDKMEIIDGQHRLEALKRLGKPVEYIVQNNLNIKEVLYMNINQDKWTMMDYIKSHAELRNESYKKLLDLIELYPIYNLNTIGCALKGINKIGNKLLQKGNLEVSQYEFENAIIKLNYLNRFIPLFKYLLGRTTYFCQAIMIVYDMEDVDKERLLSQITNNVRSMIPFSDFNTCLQSIEEIYNKQLGFKNRVDIYKQYRQGVLSKKNTNRRFERVGQVRERELEKKIQKQEGKKYEIEIRQGIKG